MSSSSFVVCRMLLCIASIYFGVFCLAFFGTFSIVEHIISTARCYRSIPSHTKSISKFNSNEEAVHRIHSAYSHIQPSDRCRFAKKNSMGDCTWRMQDAEMVIKRINCEKTIYAYVACGIEISGENSIAKQKKIHENRYFQFVRLFPYSISV